MDRTIAGEPVLPQKTLFEVHFFVGDKKVKLISWSPTEIYFSWPSEEEEAQFVSQRGSPNNRSKPKVFYRLFNKTLSMREKVEIKGAKIKDDIIRFPKCPANLRKYYDAEDVAEALGVGIHGDIPEEYMTVEAPKRGGKWKGLLVTIAILSIILISLVANLSIRSSWEEYQIYTREIQVEKSSALSRLEETRRERRRWQNQVVTLEELRLQIQRETLLLSTEITRQQALLEREEDLLSQGLVARKDATAIQAEIARLRQRLEGVKTRGITLQAAQRNYTSASKELEAAQEIVDDIEVKTWEVWSQDLLWRQTLNFFLSPLN